LPQTDIVEKYCARCLLEIFRGRVSFSSAIESLQVVPSQPSQPQLNHPIATRNLSGLWQKGKAAEATGISKLRQDSRSLGCWQGTDKGNLSNKNM